MKLERITRRARGGAPLARATLLLTGVALAASACNSILDVNDPDITRESFFTDETAVPAIQAAAIGDFRDGYELASLYGGLLGDEWVHSGTFPTRQEVDQRIPLVNNSTLAGVFSAIARGGATADFAAARYDVIDQSGIYQQAEARSLAGFTFVAFAENYCSGVPISRLVSTEAADSFRYGPPLTTTMMLDSAIARFNTALAIAGPEAADDDDYATQAMLAAVGKGRALLDQGRYQEAAQAVADVSTEFVYRIDHSANSDAENNNFWAFNINVGRWSVANEEGDNGLAYRDAEDPRMPWIRDGFGFDGGTPLYDALKYSDRPAFTPLAGGVEARLIEAEAALQSGDTETFITTLNDLRADVPNLMRNRIFNYLDALSTADFAATLMPVALPATRDAQVNLLFQERAYWLWLTGHRLGDMRRLIRQYGRSADDVYPVGNYAPNGNDKGGFYGDAVNLPIPVQELNNPTAGAGQCLNRDA